MPPPPKDSSLSEPLLLLTRSLTQRDQCPIRVKLRFGRVSVPKEGLEPSRGVASADFESAASAIPPLRLVSRSLWEALRRTRETSEHHYFHVRLYELELPHRPSAATDRTA